MSLNYHARITADGKQAKAELSEAGASAKKLGKELQGVGTSARPAGRGLASVAADARGVETTHTLAAGSVGNLTAQFNDIGIMMAAGQNPLQLAIQQGTQITQVIGPMGAAGAARALGAAFMSMLNPVSLITIGTIAAGAAVTQWLAGAKEGAKDLSDQMDELKEVVDAYASSVELAGTSTGDLDARFASSAREIRGTLALLEQIAASQAQRKIDEINSSISDLMGIGGSGDARTGIADFFDVNIFLAFTDAQREARSEARALTAEFQKQQDALRQSGGDLDAQIDAMRGLLAAAQALAAANGGVNAEEELLIENLAKTLLLMERQKGAAEAVATSLDGVKRIAGDILGISDGMDFSVAISAADTLAAKLGRAWTFAVGIANNLKTQAHAAALDTYDLGAQAAAYGGAQTTQREQEALQRYSVDGRLPSIPAETGRASGGAAKATKADRDAVAELIVGLEQERDILRESDPVQQEMIRLRGTLSAATDDQRLEIEGLIETMAAEELAKAQAAETSEFFRTSMADLIPGLTKGGDEAAASWQRLVSVLEDAAWQALLLGEGPLMGLLGGGGGGAFGGGLIGMVGKLFGFADGGMHYGRGGPRDDKELIRVSPGEYTVNAAATKKHRALLEAINAGAPIPGFAAGGYHGSNTSAPTQMALSLNLIDQTSRGLRLEQDEQSDPSRLPQFIASDMVSQAMNTRGGSARKTMQGLGLRQPMVRT